MCACRGEGHCIIHFMLSLLCCSAFMCLSLFCPRSHTHTHTLTHTHTHTHLFLSLSLPLALVVPPALLRLKWPTSIHLHAHWSLSSWTQSVMCARSSAAIASQSMPSRYSNPLHMTSNCASTNSLIQFYSHNFAHASNLTQPPPHQFPPFLSWLLCPVDCAAVAHAEDVVPGLCVAAAWAAGGAT